MGWQTESVVQLIAGNTIINASGDFIYDGSPAAGNLMIALAPAAGTDSFGNAYIKGIQVGKNTDTAQIDLVPGSGGAAARINFVTPSVSVSNTPNMAGGLSGGTPELLMSGPGGTVAGRRDWVQILMQANTGSAEAACAFIYVDTSGTPQTAGFYNGATWQIANLAIGGHQALPLSGVVSQIQSLPNDSNSGSTWVSGERAFMNNNWVANVNFNFAVITTALQNAGIIDNT
jgi:hypothetical protein